jgi:hypothetical protein
VGVITRPPYGYPIDVWSCLDPMETGPSDRGKTRSDYAVQNGGGMRRANSFTESTVDRMPHWSRGFLARRYGSTVGGV